jgi:hypothetical protein
MVCSPVHLLKYSGRSHKKIVLTVLSLTLYGLCPVPTAGAQTLPTTNQPSPTPTPRERLQRLQEGAQATPEPLIPDASIDTLRFPTLGSPIFDAQLSRYLSYIEAVGTPDILIVGSSRSLQGIDPTELRYRLSVEGYEDLKVYNFSVNGATAQVVNFLVSELLPGELPRVIVWGDGSRAFNNGRRDRTWQTLTASAGYQSVLRGEKPSVEPAAIDGGSEASEPIRLDLGPLDIDRLGFSAVRDRFNPTTYYREFTKIQGRYDGAYSPFVLTGPQSEALAQLSNYVKAQGSQMIFVNLPLSSSYLDSYRLHRENQFQDFLNEQGDRYGFEVVDLLTQWESQPELFADPSHINQYGAAAIAQQLARNSVLLAAVDTEGQTDAQPSLTF